MIRQSLGAVLEVGAEQNLKTSFWSVPFRDVFLVVVGAKSDFLDFSCVNFYACFWHRFWQASSTELKGSGRVFDHFRIFFGMLQNCKNATSLEGNA